MASIITGWRITFAALAALAGCGGDDPVAASEEPLPLGGSRWASQEIDNGADGTVDLVIVYRYDADHRRAGEALYAAVGGAPDGKVLQETTWTYDGAGRMVGIRIQNAQTGRGAETTVTYGPDGRLETRHDVSSPEGFTLDTRFVWRGGRIVEATLSGASVSQVMLTYGADGRIARVVGSGLSGFIDRYAWRTDGQVASVVDDGPGTRQSTSFNYDAAGTLLSSRENDDGLESESQLAHDPQGRLTEVARGAVAAPGAFQPYSLRRYRWQAAPCRPVRMPVLPPYREDVSAGLVSATSVSFGCAP